MMLAFTLTITTPPFSAVWFLLGAACGVLGGYICLLLWVNRQL